MHRPNPERGDHLPRHITPQFVFRARVRRRMAIRIISMNQTPDRARCGGQARNPWKTRHTRSQT